MDIQVLGSAVNSNGARAPLHAPSGVAQQECIKAAYKQAGRDPTDVDFVELHATGKPIYLPMFRSSEHIVVTGTAVGDPIECNAAGPIFARSDDVIVGSLKGNLGLFLIFVSLCVSYADSRRSDISKFRLSSDHLSKRV